MLNKNEKTFVKLFDHNWEKMFVVAFKLLKDKDLAKDVVQQVFIDFWEKERIKTVLHIEHYLMRATKFAALKQIRDFKTENLLPIHAANNFEVIENNNYDSKLLQNQIDTAINELPAKCKEIFVLSRSHQLTNKQIAEKLNLSQRTVETQISKALKHLKYKLNYKGLLALLVNFI